MFQNYRVAQIEDKTGKKEGVNTIILRIFLYFETHIGVFQSKLNTDLYAALIYEPSFTFILNFEIQLLVPLTR